MASTKDNIIKRRGVTQKQTTPPPAVPAAQTTEEVKPAPQPAVLTPEQTAVERNRIAADTSATMDAQHANNLKQLNYDNIAKMLNEASAAGQAQQAAKAEAEEKRRRRSALFNAIGDGVAALSNLYFTTKGAPSVNYNATNSLSERSRARWDEIDKNRQAELERAYLRQDQTLKQQIDNERQRRAEERQARKDAADEAYRQGQAAAAQRRHEETMTYNRERDKSDQEKWRAQLASQEKIAQINQAGQTKIAEISSDTKKAISLASTAKAARGTRLPFSDGKDNNVSIYENVWKTSMPQVYKAMKEDGVKSSLLDVDGTPSQIEAFVKENWTKSAKARSLMKALSQIDPAADLSEIEDEDYSQYEVSNDEDYSQYEVK